MFGRKHSGRKPVSKIFMLFRLILSLTMFAILFIGVYSAYKHFSGLDPLTVDPKSLIINTLQGKVPDEAISLISSIGLPQVVTQKINQDVLGRSDSQSVLNNLTTQPNKIEGKPIFKFLLIADSHSDNGNLNKALLKARQNYPDLEFIIGLGDYTEVGTINELEKAKKEFDFSGLRYFLIPGDHDLWDSRDKNKPPLTNFRQIFGPSYQSFTHKQFTFVLLYNSDNYLGMDEAQIGWLSEEIDKGKNANVLGTFVFVHEPLFHPSSDHIMGRINSELKNQAKFLTTLLSGAGVKKVFAGDAHYFSQYNEPLTNLSMVTVGAVATERNPQVPRFAVVTVFSDGLTQVEDVEIR